jgi:cation transport ATPase
MDKLAELSHGAKVVLGAAIAYFIVLFFRWQEVDVGGVVSVGQSGWHGVGVICGLLALAIIAWQAVRLANINLEVGVTPSMVTAALAVLLIVFTIIKFLVDNEFRTFWAWLGLILAIVIVVGAWMNMQAAGEGLADIRSQVSSAAASAKDAVDRDDAPAAAAPAAPAAPAPSEPAAPEAAPPPPPPEPAAPDAEAPQSTT